MTALQIQSKLPQSGTTIFTVMSALASEHQAINLGQGFPDFPMSPELIELVSQAMKNGNNQYVHMNGYAPLRAAIAKKATFLYKTEINPEQQITITPGGTYALYTALTTVLQPGDEAIVFEPAYDCYIPAVKLCGATAVPIQLKYPDYSIDWVAVKSKITKKTRVIIINSPHNPSGSVLAATDMEELSALVKDTQIIIISDEVYEHLIFEGLQHQSILKYPELLQRSLVCFSFGKVYHCTGWKLGYCIGPELLMKEFRKIHQFNAFCCDTPKQVALAEFISRREYFLELGSFLQKKRDFFQNLMKNTKFQALPSYGSYFQIYSYKEISSESEKDFAIRLTKQYGVATIPVSAFYQQPTDNKVLRFCFAKKETTLEAAVKKLVQL